MCKDAQNYNSSDPNCLNLDDFNKNFIVKYGPAISFLYPQYYFAASDLKNPLRVAYKNYYYYLTGKSKKIDRYFLNKVTLKDDQGWIFEDIKSNSLLSYSKSQTEQTPVDIAQGTSSLIYRGVFYMEKSSLLIRRSFMKVRDVSAKVGGIIKLIMTMFSLLNQFFGNFNFQISVFNEIFEFSDDDEQSSLGKSSRRGVISN